MGVVGHLLDPVVDWSWQPSVDVLNYGLKSCASHLISVDPMNLDSLISNMQELGIHLHSLIVIPTQTWGFWDWVPALGSIIAICLAGFGILKFFGKKFEKLLWRVFLKHSPDWTMLVMKQTIAEIRYSIRLTNQTKLQSFGFRLVADTLLWAACAAVIAWLLPSPYDLTALIILLRAIIPALVLRRTLWVVENLEQYVTKQREKAQNISIILSAESKKLIDEQFDDMLALAIKLDRSMLGSEDEFPSKKPVVQTDIIDLPASE